MGLAFESFLALAGFDLLFLRFGHNRSLRSPAPAIAVGLAFPLLALGALLLHHGFWNVLPRGDRRGIPRDVPDQAVFLRVLDHGFVQLLGQLVLGKLGESPRELRLMRDPSLTAPAAQLT